MHAYILARTRNILSCKGYLTMLSKPKYPFKCPKVCGLVAEEVASQQVDRTVGVGDFFCGSGGIEAASESHGIGGVGLDRERDPSLDILIDEGFLNVWVPTALKIKHMGTFGNDCSSWGWPNCSQHKRREKIWKADIQRSYHGTHMVPGPRVEGDATNPNVRDGNKALRRTEFS